MLVIAARPDLLNRARVVFAEWDRAGVLEKTIVVISSQLPTTHDDGLADMLVNVVSGAVGGVIGLDYDLVIGAGTALDQDARRGASRRRTKRSQHSPKRPPIEAEPRAPSQSR